MTKHVAKQKAWQYDLSNWDYRYQKIPKRQHNALFSHTFLIRSMTDYTVVQLKITTLAATTASWIRIQSTSCPLLFKKRKANVSQIRNVVIKVVVMSTALCEAELYINVVKKEKQNKINVT